jgi:hypothetical protein
VTQTSQMTVEIMTDVICSALSDVERFRTVIPSSNMTRGQFLLRYFENGVSVLDAQQERAAVQFTE